MVWTTFISGLTTWLSVVIIFTSLPVSVNTQCSGTWGSCLPNSNCHQVDWRYIQASDEIEITMKANIAATEWIGIGFSEDQQMINTDTYVGWISSQTTTVLDGYATTRTMPGTDTTQDLTSVEGTQVNGVTIIKFKRPKTNTDTTNDFQFNDTSCPYFLYAKGGTYDNSAKTFNKHNFKVASGQKTCVICPQTSELGGYCSSDSGCSTSNALCDITDSKCKCRENFYDSNDVTEGGTCNAKSQLGGSCSSNNHCSGSNVECNALKCQCKQGYYDDNTDAQAGGTCVAKITKGLSCLSSPPDACADIFQCINGVCDCPSTHYWNGAQCVTKSQLGGSCSSNNHCSGSNVECNAQKCRCKQGYYDDNTDAQAGGTCVAISTVGFDQPCSVSATCDTTKSLQCVGQTSKICKCQSDLYHFSGTCTNNQITNLSVSNLQATAISQTEIRVNWNLPSHASVISRYEVLWTGNTVPRNVTPSTTTTYTIDNLTPGTTYSVRVTSVDTTSRFTEQKTYPSEVLATTDALKGFDESCSSTVKCDESKNLGCTTNTQPVCKCIQNHYYSGSICSSTLDNLKVRSPSAVANSQTQVTISWGSPIASTAVNTIELSWTPSHGESQPKLILGTSTRTTISGLQVETDYSITITSKDTSSGSTTISQSVIATVKTKSALGGSCSSVNNCDGSYVECVASKCQCQTNYYDDNNALAAGTCKPISELRVTNVQVTVHDTTSVNVAWTNPSATVNSAIESKQVNWTGTTTASKNIAVTDTSTTVTGLTPGGGYTFSVVSIDSNSRTSSQEVSSVTAQVTTKPAAPGKIGSIVPDNTGYHVTLSWIASAGVVTHYRVVFDGGNGDTRTQTTSTNSINMTSLTPGRRYNITITAVSGIMTSDPVYGNTRTTVIAPGAPTNLQCVTIMDTNVTLSWTPPVNPNGDIMYYSVNVISGPGSPRTVNTTTPTPTKEIDKLTEDNYYSFTVRARNDKYTGPQSMSVTCKTKPGLPSKPQDLFITAVLSRDFNVSWMKPNSTKGQLIGYRIAVNNGTTCSKEILYQCSNCVQKPSFTSSCPIDARITVLVTDTGLQNDSFVQNVVSLYPYTSYRVLVNAITEAGDGYAETAVVETNQEAPQDLTPVSADVLNSTAIKLTWSIPGPRPGVTNYTIYLYDVINGKQTLNKIVSVSGFYERSTILTNLEEYWQYVINIKSSTSIGTSAVKTIKPDKTLPAAPGKVTDFSVSKPDGDYKTAIVTWSIPSLRDRNSLITSYEFIHNATGTLESKILSQSTNNEDPFTESITVQPENYYYIEVFAISHENKSGVKSSELYYAPPGPPPNLESTGEKVILKDKNTPATQTTATLIINRNQLTAEGNGKIHSNGIIMCPEKVQVATQRQYKDYELFTSWKKAKNNGFKQCYKPTNSSWLQSSKSVTVRKRSTNEHISYTIGDDQTCDKKSENNYCNGPLNPGTSYKAYTFVCTNGGCTESQPIIIITAQTPPSIPFAIIGGVIGALVVIIIVLVVVIIVLKKRRARKGNTHKEFDELKDYVDETETIQKERPFQLQNCAARVADLHKDANLKFAAEYEDIKALSPKHTTDAAEMDQNRLKNRYVNILPFDHSRVKLLPIDDDESTDFINANYLPGYNSPREYIGTQGPIPGTIDDFWRMVWEQNVGIIVMLTLVKEEGRIKCEEYWPMERNDPKQYGELVVETTSYSTVNFYDFRIFKIKLGDKVRTVKHFHFLNWKDFSANVQNDVMIDFIQNVRSHVQPPDKEGPMIVHCSAGVGRTGTYICLDHLMQLINEHDLNTTIDIFVMVLKLRENRSFMVQTEQQYVFIHDCVKDIIEKKKLALQDQGGEDLYMNQDENLYANQAFETEESFYQNVETRTDL